MRRDLIGETLLNQFRVETYIASGGMATIYRVWDLQRSVPLAMKVLHPELADDPSFIARFEREAQSLQMLVHPHIVPFYGLYRADGLTFLLERYIDGPSLDEILRLSGGKALPLPEVLVYFKALYTCLGYAHAQGIIHCDVKPGNVLIDQGGHVYLTDFGIARYMDSAITTSNALGTPLYMAPEQIRGERLSPQTDIYSLGVMMYEMLTGQRPFTGEDLPPGAGSSQSDRIRYQHLYAPPPDPRAYNPNLPDGIANVLLRAMAKDPRDRFPSTQAMAEEITRVIAARLDTLPDRVRLIHGAGREPPDMFSPSQGEAIPEWRQPAAAEPPHTWPSASPVSLERPAARRSARRWLVGLVALAFISLCILTGVQIARGIEGRGGSPPALPGDPTSVNTPTEDLSIPVPTRTAFASATITAEAARPEATPTPSIIGDFAVDGQIAIVQRQDGDKLFLLNARSGQAEALPGVPNVDERLSHAPQWSPDGTRLTWMSQYNGRLHIVVMGMDEREPYQLPAGEAYGRVSSPAWTPDGQQVTFWAQSGGQNLLVYADGTTGEEVGRVELPGYRNLFVWNFATGQVSFVQQVNNLYEVVVSGSPDTANQRIESGAEEYAPAWSRDGEWLAFQSDAGRAAGENEIWIVRANGSDLRQVTSSPQGTWSRAPTWSPDGRMIAYVSNRAGSLGADFGELFVVNVEDGEVRQLTETGGSVYDWRPGWRP